jgi:hypothetical protein
VLQRLGDHIGVCQERAAEAERRAAKSTDPFSKDAHLEVAKRWAHLARSYEFLVSLERFLLDAHMAKETIPPQPPE